MARALKTKRRPWKPGDRVLVYVRVSRVGERGDDLISDEVQEDVCRRWAEREGLTIVGEPISDIDKSGREVTKRQIAKSIDRVRRGEAEGIVVWKVSRWGRNLIDSMLNVHELQEAGGFIASATENLEEIETPMGRFSLTQMLAIAQLQSDQIGETWTNIHDYRRGLGLPHTGGDRFGYIYDTDAGTQNPTKAYSLNPQTAPWLAKAYRDFAAGKPASAIVRELDENGIRSVKGNRIIYRSLMQALDSGFGAGLIVDRRDDNGKPRKASTNPNTWTFLPGAHEPVIDMATWEAYLRRRRDKRPPREKAAVTRLSGLVYCASCKRKMRLRWSNRSDGTRYRRWQCQIITGRYATTQTCEGKGSIAQEQLEALVFDWLTENAQGEGAFATAQARMAQAERAKADVDTIKAEITRQKKRLSKLTDLLLDEDDEETIDTFREKQAEIRAEISTLEAQRDNLEVEVRVSEIPTVDAFSALGHAWASDQYAMMNEALRMVIRRIYVTPGARVHNKSRVKIVGTWESDEQAA